MTNNHSNSSQDEITLTAEANAALEAASNEHDAIVDAMNETMAELARQHQELAIPLVNELARAREVFRDINGPAEQIMQSVEQDAQRAYDRAVSIAAAELALAISHAREEYVARTADVRQKLEYAQKTHDDTVKTLNRIFRLRTQEFKAQLHQKEFELVRNLKRRGIQISGFSKKRPTPFRTPKSRG